MAVTPEQRRNRGIPPLVWIVLALVAAWMIWWFFVQDGGQQSSRGIETPVDRPTQEQRFEQPEGGASPATPPS